MDVRNKCVPLTKAALLLRRTYQSARDLVLRGELRGWQDDRGKWWVDREDLNRLQDVAQLSSERTAT